MNDTGAQILEALFSIFDGEEKKAQANLTNYLNNAAGIGEHPDVVAEAKKISPCNVSRPKRLRALFL